MATATLPEGELVRDPDLNAALKAVLGEYTGKAWDRAYAAIRTVRASGLLGSYSELLTAYTKAIREAVKEK